MEWHTFKQLSKEAELIYCFHESNCSAAGFIQADESDIANGIGLERRSDLNPFGNVVILALKELEIMTLSWTKEHTKSERIVSSR